MMVPNNDDDKPTEAPISENKKSSGAIHQKMSKSELSTINYDDVLVLRVKKELGNIVKELIKDKKWTQAQAAEYLGINQPRVSDIVNGRVNRHSVDKLIEILDIFGYSINIILSKETETVDLSIIK